MVNNPPAYAGDAPWIPERLEFDPWVGRSLGEGNGSPFQRFCLKNSVDKERCRVMLHGVAKSQIQLC